VGVNWKKAVGYGAVFAAILIVLGAGPRDFPEYREADALGRKIIEDTQNFLLKEVQEKGPAEALTQCSAVTQAMAQQHELQGWRVRRVSQKVRNPANAPNQHETKILKDFETLKRAGRLDPDIPNARIDVRDGKRDLWYMRPILITHPVCLQCHGQPEDLLPAVKALLQKVYPRDRATGYQLHDILGAVSIETPLPDL
jgi:Protein of unknown function (DUF3365)